MNNRKLTTGFYRPTESFKLIQEHIAVCFEDDLTLVAVVGASNDDPDHVTETNEYAALFASAPDTLQKLSHALARIAELTEETDRANLRIIAKDMQIAELTRMLFALGKQDGQTIRELTEENRGLRQMLHMEQK